MSQKIYRRYAACDSCRRSVDAVSRRNHTRFVIRVSMRLTDMDLCPLCFLRDYASWKRSYAAYRTFMATGRER